MAFLTGNIWCQALSFPTGRESPFLWRGGCRTIFRMAQYQDFPILWPAWAMPWPVHEILILRFVDQYKFRWTEISWLVGGIVVVACSQLLMFPVLLNIKGKRGQRKARNNRWVLTCLANRTEPNITEYGNVCEHYVLSQLASWEQRQARSWLNRPGPGLDHI